MNSSQQLLYLTDYTDILGATVCQKKSFIEATLHWAKFSPKIPQSKQQDQTESKSKEGISVLCWLVTEVGS